MDDTPANKTPGENFNKLDLSALQAFEFGTQWTDAGSGKPSSGGSSTSEHARDSGAARRDRRPPRRPPGAGGGSGAPGGGGGHSFENRDTGGHRGPPRDRPGPAQPGDAGRVRRREFGGGDRGESHGDQRPRFDRGEGRDHGGPRRFAGPPRPYMSPVFELTFYPDDTGFNALVKAMRASCRTYELFEIARLILGKIERCVVVFTRRPETPGGSSGPLYVSVPDGLPFPTEDEAVNHALQNSMETFFSKEDVEVEPPKGSFQFVNRCPITKDLLGPPNYHRYPQILQHHYEARGIRMPFDRYKSAVEVVRDEEAVNQWLESMKKTTRYTFRTAAEGEVTVFDNIEDARAFLLRTCRERIVRAAENARVSAKAVEAVEGTEAIQAMHGALEMQRRFPLDTANALRGRLRRENFHIFKRGSKGVTYVCSVRRKFRQPGQAFSDSLNALIEFLDANPLINVGDLPLKFLGFAPPASLGHHPAAAAPAQAPTPSDGSSVPAEGAAPPDGAEPVASAAPAEPALSSEQRTRLNRLVIDLRWLVSEGYVAEYSDGRLFAHPVLVQGQPEPVEKDHDSHEAPVAHESPEGAPEAAADLAAAEPASSEPVADEPAADEPVSAEDVPASTDAAPAADPARDAQSGAGA